ncbi:MAG: DUF2092 domain-containing protein [Polymorphobacter sp.]
MKRLHAALLGSLSLAVLALPVHAASPPAKATTAAPAVPAVDPVATAGLDRMAAYLRTLKEFEVTVYSTTEDVLDSGQKIMTNNQVRYVMQAPNKLHAMVSGDKIKRHYYFDGKTFTVRNNQNDFYAQVPFTGTITQLLSEVEKYGVDLPLQDLFRWGDPATTSKPTEGIVVGDSRVVDWETDHYAFRQEGVDFQVWVEKGDKPLPRKLVINNLEDETQPQYVAVMNWNLSPKIDAAEFTFTPGPDSKRIPFMTPEALAAATAAKKPAK